MKRYIIITIILLLISTYIFTEIIILENGKIIDGKIIKMDEDTMTVITKNKEIIIDRDDIIQTFRSMKDYDKFKKSLKSNNKTDEKGNLIAEWLFNGNADDTSGNELHGKVFGSKKMVEDRFGNKDSAYEFGVGKTRLIQVNKKLSILQPEKISISFWIKAVKFSDWIRMIDFYKWSGKFGYVIQIGSRNTIDFSTFSNNKEGFGIRTKTIIDKFVWYHVVVTYDKKSVKIYLNNILDNKNDISKSIYHAKLNETNFYIGSSGQNNSGTSYMFYGCIDDIKIYDYALSEEEIDKLYHENGWPK